jgi:hypothetical protein
MQIPSWAGWYMPVIPDPLELRQRDEVSQSYTARPRLKINIFKKC